MTQNDSPLLFARQCLTTRANKAAKTPDRLIWINENAGLCHLTTFDIWLFARTAGTLTAVSAECHDGSCAMYRTMKFDFPG
jgi:hypothetical protein